MTYRESPDATRSDPYERVYAYGSYWDKEGIRRLSYSPTSSVKSLAKARGASRHGGTAKLTSEVATRDLHVHDVAHLVTSQLEGPYE